MNIHGTMICKRGMISNAYSGIKDLKSISEPYKTKLHTKILELQKFPNLQNIKKLTNFEPAYRLRVGKKVLTQNLLQSRFYRLQLTAKP